MAKTGARTNWFAIWVSAAVVVVLVVVGIVCGRGETTRATAPGDAPSASNIDADTGAIHHRRGARTSLATYIDFMCPVCGDFEAALRTLDRGTRRRRIDHARHPPDLDPRPRVAGHRVLDPRPRTPCTASRWRMPTPALPFMTAMFENQPAEASTPGSERRADPRDCRRRGRHRCRRGASTTARTSKYVTEMTAKTPVALPARRGIGTPSDRRQRRGHRPTRPSTPSRADLDVAVSSRRGDAAAPSCRGIHYHVCLIFGALRLSLACPHQKPHPPQTGRAAEALASVWRRKTVSSRSKARFQRRCPTRCSALSSPTDTRASRRLRRDAAELHPHHSRGPRRRGARADDLTRGRIVYRYR